MAILNKTRSNIIFLRRGVSPQYMPTADFIEQVLSYAVAGCLNESNMSQKFLLLTNVDTKNSIHKRMMFLFHNFNHIQL